MKNLIIICFIFLEIHAFCIKPERNYAATPDSLGLPYKNVTIITPDGFDLNCWIIPPTSIIDKKTSVVIAYPDAGNMSYYLYYAAMLARNGYTAVLFDYRGFGKSADFKMKSEMLFYSEFVIDLESVIKWTKTNSQNTKTGVWALSMGTIITTLVTKTETLDFIIAEGYVCSPDTIKDRYKRIFNKEIMLPNEDKSYANILNDINIKMLICGGLKDEITTIADVKKIAGQNPKRQIVEYDGKHLQALWVLTDKEMGDLYFKKVIDFLTELD